LEKIRTTHKPTPHVAKAAPKKDKKHDAPGDEAVEMAMPIGDAGLENLEEELEAVMQSDAELSPEDIAKVEGILKQSVQIDDGDDEENDAVDGDVALDPDDKSLIAQAELGKELKCQGIVSGDLSPDVLDIANALSQSDDYKDMPLEELLVEAAKHHSAKVKDAEETKKPTHSKKKPTKVRIAKEDYESALDSGISIASRVNIAERQEQLQDEWLAQLNDAITALNLVALP
jgi:hypothetical protein